MQILTTIQRFLGWKSQVPSVATTTRVLTDLQHLCHRFPQGEAEVVCMPGQLNICFTWTPSATDSEQHGVVFWLNGETDRVQYAEFQTDDVTEEPKTAKSKTVKPQTKETQAAKSAEKLSKQQTVLKQLLTFLELHYAFRYNCLTDQTEYAVLAVDTDETHERVYQPVDNRAMNSISLSAIRAGVECWDRDVKRYLDSAEIPAYHPFTNYFQQLPSWDGVDRVTPLAQRVSTDEVWVRSFHRWMLANVSQWMQTGNSSHPANSVAPILISTRQGMGKSTFCRNLLPACLQTYYTDSYDLTQPSSAENKLSAFGLINLDEFDRISASRMAQLKNLMQMQSLHLRRAYKQHGEPLPRIASFIGTSNRRDLLTDLTGSRRFICVEVHQFIDCQTPIEYEQLYAQLKQEVQNGARSWFNKEEEAEIQEANRAYYRVSPAQELLEGAFQFAQPGEEGAHLLSAAQLYAQLKKKNPAALRDCSPTAFSRMLAQVATRVHTRYGNGYWVK